MKTNKLHLVIEGYMPQSKGDLLNYVYKEIQATFLSFIVLKQLKHVY